jgi:hypothetical protein
LPRKTDGMSGAEVEKYYRDGHIREIAECCESDVVDTAVRVGALIRLNRHGVNATISNGYGKK